MAIRLGGIYALERIAKDSEKDHGPIMEVLTAYVRENAPRPAAAPPPAAPAPLTPPRRPGREEAQLSIGPVFVGAAGLEVCRAIVVQVAPLAQRGEVEEGRGGRGAVVDVGRANNHPAARDRVRLAFASSAPLTPISGPDDSHEPGPERPVEGIAPPHVARRVVLFQFQGFGFLHRPAPPS